MLVGFPSAQRAPGRGRYERRRSNAERFLAQRHRLLRATAIAHLEEDESVTRVTLLSGVGRTTFYECFDDFGHALAAVRFEAGQRVRRGLSQRSKRLDLLELCGVWLRALIDEPMSALVALESRSGGEPEVLTLLGDALCRLFPAAKMRSPALMHALACAHASARAAALVVLNASSESPEPAEANAPVEHAREALARSIHCLLADEL
jgi:hypothetical protein